MSAPGTPRSPGSTTAFFPLGINISAPGDRAADAVRLGAILLDVHCDFLLHVPCTPIVWAQTGGSLRMALLRQSIV